MIDNVLAALFALLESMSYDDKDIDEKLEIAEKGIKNIITTFATEKDHINPDHYKSYSVETIVMMERIYGASATVSHCEMTAFAYRMRLGKKDNVEQELKKEKWYLDKAAELRIEELRLVAKALTETVELPQLPIK